MTSQLIKSLREAVSASPMNGKLRLRLANALRQNGQWMDAVSEYLTALRLPGTPIEKARFGLATTLFHLNKPLDALGVVHTLLNSKLAMPVAPIHLLHARLLLQSGNRSRAISEYRRAVEGNPALADAELAEALGIEQSIADEEHEIDASDIFSHRSIDPLGLANHRDDYKPTASELVDELEEWMAQSSPSEDENRQRVCAYDPGLDVDDETLELEVGGERIIDFAAVGGLENIKEEIAFKIIHPLRQPELYKTYGRAPGGNVLLYGPPGCGKTHLARATAGEVQAGFISVTLDMILGGFPGSHERNLHELFELARRNAPCVLFFDEIDALGGRRRDMRAGARRYLVSQLLCELDGLNASNQGVLIMAATNTPWHLDPALLRSGRFDRALFVPPPNDEARRAILNALLEEIPTAAIEYDWLLPRLSNLSGADLKTVVDMAIESKLKDSLRLGVPKPLLTKDLYEAAKRVKITTAPWFDEVREHAQAANPHGFYDDVLAYLENQNQ